tara:strand:- start:48205 stop:48981 length:777 start_codon:yes stop_codon:yes gene_type:complete
MLNFRFKTFILSLCLINTSWAQENLLAIGQGISSPTSTSTVNYSNGFTHENPVGTIYQGGARFSLQYDDNDNNSGLGGELGIGQGNYGLALGYYKNDCDSCDGDIAAAAAGSLGTFSLGLRVEEDLLTLGVVVNPTGQHRFGFTADINESDSSDSVKSFGVGYSLVKGNVTATLDASKQDRESDSSADDIIALTPGLRLQADMLALSVSYDMFVNEPEGSNRSNDLWFGVGIGKGQNWHLAIYKDYVADWALVGSLFF